MKRYVDPVKAARVVAEAPPGEAAAKLRRWLEKQPSAPNLISRDAAAKRCGVNSPYISRLEDQGRMPEAIPVEGGGRVWESEEVDVLAEEIRTERQKRARKKEEVSPK